MSRHKLNLSDKIWILTRQARCAMCMRPLYNSANAVVDYHHINELEISGDDSLDNIVAVHRACHKILTGGTPATSLGSSKHRIAKVKRLEKRRLGGETKKKRKIPSRPMRRPS
jgi:hypothetical protein